MEGNIFIGSMDWDGYSGVLLFSLSQKERNEIKGKKDEGLASIDRKSVV